MARIECTVCGSARCSTSCYKRHEQSYGCHESGCALHEGDVLCYNNKLYHLSDKDRVMGREGRREDRQGRGRNRSPPPSYEWEDAESQAGRRSPSTSAADSVSETEIDSASSASETDVEGEYEDESRQYRAPPRGFRQREPSHQNYYADEPQQYRGPPPEVPHAYRGQDINIDMDRLRNRFSGVRFCPQRQAAQHAQQQQQYGQGQYYSQQQYPPQYPQQPQHPYGYGSGPRY